MTLSFRPAFLRSCPAILLAMVVLPTAHAGEKFRTGDLKVVASKSRFELIDESGRNVRFVSGAVQIMVKKKGILGDGGFTLSTNADTVEIKVPRKAYDKGTNFMLYATASGQKYNIQGAQQTATLSTGARQRKSQSCLYNGVVVGQTLVCGKNKKEYKKDEIVVNLCTGTKLVEVQATTTQDLYSLKFFDPANPDRPIAEASLRQDPVTEDEVAEELTACG